MSELISTLKKKAQAGNEWSNILPRSMQARIKPPHHHMIAPLQALQSGIIALVEALLSGIIVIIPVSESGTIVFILTL